MPLVPVAKAQSQLLIRPSVCAWLERERGRTVDDAPPRRERLVRDLEVGQVLVEVELALRGHACARWVCELVLREERGRRGGGGAGPLARPARVRCGQLLGARAGTAGPTALERRSEIAALARRGRCELRASRSARDEKLLPLQPRPVAHSSQAGLCRPGAMHRSSSTSLRRSPAALSLALLAAPPAARLPATRRRPSTTSPWAPTARNSPVRAK